MIRYLLFITVYHRLFVLWLVVAYSGLSRNALLELTYEWTSGSYNQELYQETHILV
jgi:hypothetical protein